MRSLEEDLRQAFRRNADGSWTCVAPTRLDGPSGRIEVTPGTTFMHGTSFMGEDIAKWLDERIDGARYRF